MGHGSSGAGDQKRGQDPEGRGEAGEGVQHFGGVEDGDLGRSPTKVTGKAADRGLPFPREPSPLRLQEAAPGGEKGMERSGGQSRLGKPF